MALAISSIPVLTGQAAKDFELQAQRTYAEHINSSEVEKAKINSRYEKGMQLVREILNNSDLSKEWVTFQKIASFPFYDLQKI